MTPAEGSTSIRVVKPEERILDASSGAMVREAAIAAALTGAQRLWLGYVELGPGLISAVHHHGEAESGIYLISGRARFVCGEHLDEVHDAEAGDFIWVPPFAPHVEINPSDTEPARAVVARSIQDNIVFNLSAPEGWTPPV